MEYTANITQGIVSFIRRNAGDNSRNVVKADLELFECIDEAIFRICRETKCLDLPVYIKLKPNVWEYSNGEVIKDIGCILQAKSVLIVDKNDTAIHKLEPVYESQFYQHREDNCLSEPGYYLLTDSSIRYWLPVAEDNLRLKIDCARIPLPGERVDFDRDPFLPAKYIPFIKFGAMVEAADYFPELKIDTGRWEEKFMQYEDVQVIPKTKERVNANRKEF